MSQLYVDPALPRCRTRIQEIGEHLADEGLPTGGAVEVFEPIGRHVFSKLIACGLLPESKLLDVGCGGLRCGYWLIHFLEPMGYCGIEPNREMLLGGRRRLLDRRVLSRKKPRFDHGQGFDFGVFGQRFDFVIARSIWSHASLGQIRRMLEQFVRHGTPGATLLTSFVETDREDEEYAGTDFSWPAIRYRKATLQAEIRTAGLTADFQETVQLQRWIEIRRPARVETSTHPGEEMGSDPASPPLPKASAPTPHAGGR